MLGKLLKYDFRSMWKQFAFIWPAALALALVNRFTLTLPERSSALGNIIAGIAGLVYAAILIAMCVIAVIFVIQRFFKGLLGDEGYLMNTLPVKPWQLIVSKLLCASVATIVSVLVAILSILLLAPIDGMDYIDIFRETVRVFSELIRQYHANVPLLIIEFVVLCLVGLFASYLQLYLAMAIGHLFGRNRIAMSIIAYVGINAVLSAVTTVLGITFFSQFDELLGRLMAGMSDWQIWHTMMAGLILFTAVQAVVFFIVTERILHRHLNLE